VGAEERTAVAILAGGQSQRMGTDKVLLPWNGGQVIDRMITVGRLLVDAEDVLVIGDRPPYHGRGAVVVADRFPGCGPLGAIATAMSATNHARVLVLAGDMPQASERLLRAMLALESAADAIVPVRGDAGSAHRDGRTFETLHAIYRSNCLPVAERLIEQGELAVVRLLEMVNVHSLDEPWIRRWDPEMRSFANANTPEELDRIRRSAPEE
jgi:molybdopterin-guanine dinucleotide biosynthesis protein A